MRISFKEKIYKSTIYKEKINRKFVQHVVSHLSVYLGNEMTDQLSSINKANIRCTSNTLKQELKKCYAEEDQKFSILAKMMTLTILFTDARNIAMLEKRINYSTWIKYKNGWQASWVLIQNKIFLKTNPSNNNFQEELINRYICAQNFCCLQRRSR